MASLDDLLERADASAQRDRDYLELFYEQQSSALSVRKVQAERFFTIRQFELSNGEKVAVLTDLGAPGRPRQVQDVTTVARTF